MYSSSADLSLNPAASIASGFIAGLTFSLYQSKIFDKINKNGILFSLPVMNRLLFPGIASGILSAILISINGNSTTFNK